MDMQTKTQQRLNALLQWFYARRCLASPTAPKDRRALQRRVRSGSVVMPYKGHYIGVEEWNKLSYAERIIWSLRSVCRRYQGIVLCGPSAAAVHGFTTSLKTQRYVHIAVSKRSQAGRHGFIFAHYYKDPPPTCEIDGMLVTDAMQTMMDCGRTLDFVNAFEICSMGLRKCGFANKALQGFVGRKRRLWGIIRARFVAECADPLCENGGEAVAVATIIELGYKQPQTQVTFTSPLDGREIRGDFCWERDDGSLVVGELDGRRKYTDPAMTNGAEISEVIMREKDRESELNMLQILVVRFQMEHVRKREPLRQRLEASRIPHDSNVWRSPFAGFRCVAY